MYVKEGQRKKISLPICSSEDDIVMEVRDVQSQKTSSPIVCKDDGNCIHVKEEHSANAFFLIC